jgi:hypothetical protein
MEGQRRYEILEAVGRGGFGTVYRARVVGEGGFAKLVALKVLNSDMDARVDIVGRLRDEARVLGLLNHRAIVHVDGLVRLDGRWAVVMEFVQGVDLKTIIQAAPVPLRPAVEIIQEAADALHVAWRTAGPDGQPLKLHHRDIKPSNLQLTPNGEVKLLDFGIARAEFEGRESRTEAQVYGSLGYMAPERLDHLDSETADVYSLGVTLYEMLVAEQFFKTSSHEPRHVANVAERMARLRERVPDDAALVIPLLERMLAYAPADRPMPRDVERQCRDLADSARGERLRDWAERAVPPILASLPPLDDALRGQVLSEGHVGAEPTAAGDTFGMSASAPVERAPAAAVVTGSIELDGPSVTTPPTARAWTGLQAAGVALAIAVPVVLVVAWTWGPGNADTTAAAGDPPAVEAPPAAPIDVVVPPPPSAPEPPPPESATPPTPPEPPPPTVPKPATRAKPRPVEPPPVPAEPVAAPIRVAVAVSGDADRVELVANGARITLPAQVPPGSYTIDATFAGRAPMGAGSTHVLDGKPLIVDCSALFTRCTAK